MTNGTNTNYLFPNNRATDSGLYNKSTNKFYILKGIARRKTLSPILRTGDNLCCVDRTFFVFFHLADSASTSSPIGLLRENTYLLPTDFEGVV